MSLIEEKEEKRISLLVLKYKLFVGVADMSSKIKQS